jgi:hypothetical protein
MAWDARQDGDLVTAELLLEEAMRYFDEGDRFAERWRNFEKARLPSYPRRMKSRTRRIEQRRRLIAADRERPLGVAGLTARGVCCFSSISGARALLCRSAHVEHLSALRPP